jgi:hypothetical protein
MKYYKMNYEFVRNELFQCVYNDKNINLTQKQRAMNYLLIGIYKNKILEYISLTIDMEKIKNMFYEDIVTKITK